MDLQQYRELINFEALSPEELAQTLCSKLPLQEIDPDDNPIVDKHHVEINLLNREDSSFRVFLLSDQEESKKYYDLFPKEDYEPFSGIYLILGDAGYIESNSNELFRDVFLLKGITEEQFEKGTVEARQYIDLLLNP